MIIIFDIDGVLADFEGALTNTLYSIYGNVALAHREKYSLEERYTGDVLRDALQVVGAWHSYRNLVPDMGAVKFLNNLLDMGADVVIMTNRPAESEAVTKKWLKRYVPKFSNLLNILFVKDKFSAIKKIKDVLFVVDDNPKIVNQLRQAGVEAYTWEQPWNMDVYPKLTVNNELVVMLQRNESESWTPFFQTEDEQ